MVKNKINIKNFYLLDTVKHKIALTVTGNTGKISKQL